LKLNYGSTEVQNLSTESVLGKLHSSRSNFLAKLTPQVSIATRVHTSPSQIKTTRLHTRNRYKDRSVHRGIFIFCNHGQKVIVYTAFKELVQVQRAVPLGSSNAYA